MGQALWTRAFARQERDNLPISPEIVRLLAQRAEEGRFARAMLFRLIERGTIETGPDGECFLTLTIAPQTAEDLSVFGACDEDLEEVEEDEESDFREDVGDPEPSLGGLSEIDQRHWGAGDTMDPDLELDDSEDEDDGSHEEEHGWPNERISDQPLHEGSRI